MANTLVTLAYRVRGYGAPAKGVLVRLADLANPDGTDARPTVQRLADELELSTRAVQDALKRLRQAGVIIVTTEAAGTRPRVYRLNAPLMRQLAEAADQSRLAEGVQEVHPHRGAGDAGVQDVHHYDASRGAGGSPPGVQEVHPQPPLQPVDDAADARGDDPVATPEARAVCAVVGVDVRSSGGWWMVDGEVGRWLAEGCDLNLDVLPTIRAAMQRRGSQGPPNSPRYFANAVANAKAARLAPMPEGQAHAQRQKRPDNRYDTDRRRAASARAVMVGDMAGGPDATGYG